MITDTSCPNGEDLYFIALSALSGNYEYLETGYVQPAYMNPDTGGLVAQWLLSLRDSKDPAWPPTYRAIKHQWPELDWPDVPEEQGYDPKLAAYDVFYSYRLVTSMQLIGSVQKLSQMPFAEAYNGECLRIIDKIHELRGLPDPKRRAVRLGDNPEQTMDLILGRGEHEHLALLRTGVPSLDNLLRPFEPGLYCFFARPKNMKSWVLLYAALANSVHGSFPGVLVDPENNRQTIVTRLVCALVGLNVRAVRKIQLKLLEKEPLTPEERSILDELEYGVVALNEMSSLYILGKEDIDPEYGSITTDRILALCDEVGACVIYADQIHKLVVPSMTRPADDDHARARKAILLLANLQDKVTFASTQEKREQTKRTGTKVALPQPKDDWVYGGDGAAQNCTSLVHLHAYKFTETRSLLQITPLLGRTSGIAEDPRIFMDAELCTRYEEIPQAEGIALAQAYVDRASARSGSMRRDAARQNAEEGPSPAARDSVLGRMQLPSAARAELRTTPDAVAAYTDRRR